MLSLCSGLWTTLFSRPQYQVVVIGLDGAGKTTVLERAKSALTGSVMRERVAPTVGLNVAKVDVGPARLVMWDLGGQQGLRVIWEKYYADAHAVMYVVNAADEARLAEAALELSGALEQRELSGAPVLVVANMQDAPGALTAQELERRLPVNRHGREVHFVGVSARDGDGVTDAVQWLARVLPRCPRTSRLALGASYG